MFYEKKKKKNYDCAFFDCKKKKNGPCDTLVMSNKSYNREKL